MITFLLSGFWHGASWNFIIWGGYHGVLVLLERLARKLARPFEPLFSGRIRWLTTGLKILLTFLLVNVGWLMFRETDLSMLLRDFQLLPWKATPEDNQVARYLFGLTVLYGLPIFLHGLLHLWDRWRRGSQPDYPRSWLLLRPVLAALLLMGILTLRSPEPSTFIYFQF